jgi:hypothetical protein
MDNMEWIDWAGGECPVALFERVDVKLRSDEFSTDWAFNYHWGSDANDHPSSDDIIAYRVVQS